MVEQRRRMNDAIDINLVEDSDLKSMHKQT